MSQLLATKSAIRTLVVPALCYVCNKGLENGCSLTAKAVPAGIALFCEKHYRLNQLVGVVIAPCAAEPTKEAYFAKAPEL